MHDRSDKLLCRPIVDFVRDKLQVSILQFQQAAEILLLVQLPFFDIPMRFDLPPQLLARLCQPGGAVQHPSFMPFLGFVHLVRVIQRKILERLVLGRNHFR
jgi:hypothetical protein